MLPDLNRLKVFYLIYRHKSIVGAAAVLNLTQPAVSQQLQKLEAELNLQLFTRLHKKLVATAAAERLYLLVEPFMQTIEQELPYIRQSHERPCGMLRIGAPREFGKEYLPRFCSRFRQQYPDVNFDIRFDESKQLLDLIVEGKLDFALVDVYFEDDDMRGFTDLYSSDPLLTERLLLACSQSYYLRHINGDHSLKNLRKLDYMTDEADHVILDFWFKNNFGKVPDNLNIVMNVESHEALLSGLKLGMGLGVATGHLIWEELQYGDLVPIKISGQPLVNKISLVQLQDKIPTLTEKVFRDFLLQEVEKPEIQERFMAVGDSSASADFKI